MSKFSPVEREEKNREIKEIVEKKGGKLEENWKFVNCETKIEITCKKGHIWGALFWAIKNGHWCPECAGQRVKKEDVKKFIEEKGGTLDPNWKYVNSKCPIKITCKHGHTWEAAWTHLKHKKSWCPFCVGHTVDQNEAVSLIKSKGGILAADWKYVSSTEQFWLECEFGHEWKTCWNVIQSEHWCPDCAKNKRLLKLEVDKKKLGSEVREFIKSRNWKLDPNWEYVNNSTKFGVECSKGHRWQPIWANLLKGCDCPYCAKHRVEEEHVRKFIEDKGGKVSEEWKFNSAKSVFILKCVKRHHFYTCWDKIRIGHWCPYCFRANTSEEEKVREIMGLKKGTIDPNWKYHDAKFEFDVKCSKGHVWKVNWNRLRIGRWCPICKGTKSENDFRGTMEEVFSVDFPKTKPEWLINPITNRILELDGYNRNLKLAFEYQGPYHFEGHWLQDEVEVQKRRDAIKIQKCVENKVTLIVMPYWVPKEDWKDEIKEQYDKIMSDTFQE